MQPEEYPIFDYSEDNFSFSPFDFDQGMYEEILCPQEDYVPPEYPDSPPPSPPDCYFHNYPDSPCSTDSVHDSVSPSPPCTPQGELPQANIPYTVQHVQLHQITQTQVEMKVVLSFPSQPPSTQTISINPQLTFPVFTESEPENSLEFTQIILDPNSNDPATDYFFQMKSLPFDVSKQLTDYQYGKLFKMHRKQLLLNAHPVMTERDLDSVRSCGFVYFLRNVKTIVPKIGPWKFNCHTRNTDGDRSFNIPGMAITCKVKEWLSDDGLWRLYHYKAGKRQAQ